MRRLKTDRVSNSLYTLSAECRTPTSSCFLNDTSSQTMNFVFKSWHPSSSLLSVALQQPYKVESFVLASSEGMSINSTKEKHNTTKTKKQKINRENKTKMGRLIRGGENPIPNQKTKARKTHYKKSLQVAREGLQTHTLSNALEFGQQRVLVPVHT